MRGLTPARLQPAEPRRSLWDAGLGWFLLLIFLWNLGMGAFAPLLPKVMEELGLGFAGAGLLGTAYAVARFTVDMPAGLLVDRLGPAWLFHGASAFLLAGTALAALAGGFEGMAGARALGGFGSGLANVLSVYYLMRQGSAAHRNRRANLCELAVVAGMAVSADAAGLIATRWDWRTSLGLAALLLTAVWAGGALGLLPGLRAGLSPAAASSRPAPPRAAVASSRGAVLAVFVASFAQAFAWGGGISTLLPLYGGSVLQLSPALIGRAMAVAFWVEVVLLYPVGWAADTWGKFPVLLPGFAAMLLGILLVPGAAGPVGYGAAFVCLAAGMSVWMLVPALLAEQLPGGFGGRSAGLYRLVTDFGFIVAPGLVGWLIGRFGFTAAVLAIAAVLCVSLALSALFLHPRRAA